MVVGTNNTFRDTYYCKETYIQHLIRKHNCLSFRRCPFAGSFVQTFRAFAVQVSPCAASFRKPCLCGSFRGILSRPCAMEQTPFAASHAYLCDDNVLILLVLHGISYIYKPLLYCCNEGDCDVNHEKHGGSVDLHDGILLAAPMASCVSVAGSQQPWQR